MSKFAKAAGAALSLVALVTAAGAAEMKLSPNTVKLNLSKVVGCQVAGTPSEFPDDIWIINKGLGAIAAGTKVEWSVPSVSKAGAYVLTAALAPGKGVMVSGALAGGVEAGRPCSAKAV